MSAVSSARVVVVGGGIAGLAAAHAVAASTVRGHGSVPAVLLCEASTRLGGHVRSVRDGDLLVEAGPDSLVTRKPAAVELCRALGLGDELLAARATSPAAQVVRRGRLHDLPEGSLLGVPPSVGAILGASLYSPGGKARLVAERLVARGRSRSEHADGASVDPGEDESLGELVTRRLGREAFDRVVEPVFGGLFAGDAARFSTRLVAPRLLELEARWGSFTSAARAERRAAELAAARAERSESPASPPAQVALRNGMEDLVHALARELRAAGSPNVVPGGMPGAGQSGAASAARVMVETGVDVVGVREAGGAGGFVVERGTGGPIFCDVVILAVPGPELARLVRGLDHALAVAADELGYADCATIALSYPRAALEGRLRGLGFFVPRSEGSAVLAVSYPSEKFPARAPPSQVLLRVFVGGALHPEALDLDDDEVIEVATQAVSGWLGVASRPSFARVDRQNHGIPQLVSGCGAGLARVRAGLARHPGLFVAGSALGVYGIPDCVSSGKEAATAALRWLDESQMPGALRSAGTTT